MVEATAKIAIKLPNWLGDIIMVLPFIKSLQVRNPNARIDLIVQNKYLNLAALSGYNLVGYQGSQLKLGFKLRAAGYDQYWVLPLSFSAALTAFISGAKIRIGYKAEFRSWLLNFPLEIKYQPRKQHYLNEVIGLQEGFYKSEIAVEHVQLAFPANLKDKFLPDLKEVILLSPFANYGPSKSWPYFKELATMLARYNLPIAVIGLAKDRGKIKFDDNVIDLLGKTTLEQLASLFSRTRLHVSIDCGAAHLAGAYNLNQIVIFGSTTPIWTRPLAINTKIVYEQEVCSPCFERTCRFGHYNCLAKISAMDLFKHCSASLN